MQTFLLPVPHHWQSSILAGPVFAPVGGSTEAWPEDEKLMEQKASNAPEKTVTIIFFLIIFFSLNKMKCL